MDSDDNFLGWIEVAFYISAKMVGKTFRRIKK